ncbi:signal peptidase I [Streptococcus parauberis]|uniref:signal peptidase I n=1 Tax=Streptococcus parauberis TaxID=1348 RepID=UPI0039AF581E
MVKRDFIRNIILALIIVIVAILLKIFVFSTYKVTDNSANSYLQPGDLITIKKNITPKYKDFVVYNMNGKKYMSRVVATQGEKVTYMDDIFYLNDRVEPQTYIEKEKTDYLSTAPMGSLYTDDFNISTLTEGTTDVIPQNKFLVLNDNRLNKDDSRSFGLIDKSKIKGIVIFRVLPLNKFGFVEVE